MGWPRKNEGCRLYRESGNSFIMVLVENGRNGSGHYDAIANVYIGSNPSLCSTSVSDGYIRNCQRVEWNDLPDIWKRAFLNIMQHWDSPPKEIRGLWRIGKAA